VNERNSGVKGCKRKEIKEDFMKQILLLLLLLVVFACVEKLSVQIVSCLFLCYVGFYTP
jgi:hypothetical protein